MNRKYNKLNQGPHNRLRHLVRDPGITPLSSECLGRFWSVVHVQQTSETTYPSSRRTRGFGDVACMCKDAVLSSAGAFQTEGGMLDFHACVLQRGTLPLRRGLPFPQARGDTPVGDDMPGWIPWVLHPSLVWHMLQPAPTTPPCQCCWIHPTALGVVDQEMDSADRCHGTG